MRESRTLGSVGAKAEWLSYRPIPALEPAAKGDARSAGARATEACMARAEPERPAAGQEPSMEAVHRLRSGTA